MPISTMPRILRPLMDAPSVKLNHCAICGRPAPLEQHHIVRRGAGKLFRAGKEVPKPTITLCGFGNNLRDANGRFMCHGLAHHQMLHFRYAYSKLFVEGVYGAEIGHLEYLITSKPTKYEDALAMSGWKPLPRFRGLR